VLKRSWTQKRVRTIHRAPARPTQLTLPFVRLRGPKPQITGMEQLPMRFPCWMDHLHRLSVALDSGEISEAVYQVSNGARNWPRSASRILQAETHSWRPYRATEAMSRLRRDARFRTRPVADLSSCDNLISWLSLKICFRKLLRNGLRS
jgi:hypothetical protein